MNQVVKILTAFVIVGTSHEESLEPKHNIQVVHNILESWTNFNRFTGVSDSLKEVFYQFHVLDDGINWEVNLNQFNNSKFVTKVLDQLQIPAYKYYNISGRILRRGDNVRINQICRAGEMGSVINMITSVSMNRNGYAEILFFNKEKSDILRMVRANPFSVIAFPCDVPYQWQPPAVDIQQGAIFIQIVGSNIEEVCFRRQPERERTFNTYFPPNQMLAPSQINIRQVFELTDEMKVYVVDDIFRRDQLQGLRSYFLDVASYSYHEADEHGESDNVIALAPVNLIEFTSSSIWSAVEQAIAAVSGKQGWWPYDVSCNLNEAFDHTRIHPDCFDRDEYTFLLYLNPEYDISDLGGTVWYTDESGEEILGSVLNRFGRVAVFHCAIPHAARPPHARTTTPRLTFAVKVAPSRAEALIRSWSEHGGDAEDELEAEVELWDRFKGEWGGKVEKLEREYRKVMERQSVKIKEYFEGIFGGLGLGSPLKDEL